MRALLLTKHLCIMIKQYVAFGDYAAASAADGEWKDLKCIFEDCPNSLGKREFRTEEERRAYLCGLEDAAGWMESYPLDKEEVRKLSRRVRLSDICDLSISY